MRQDRRTACLGQSEGWTEMCVSSSRVRLPSSVKEVRGRDALILMADERVTRSKLTTAPLEDHNRLVYRKPEFMFGDATPDTDQ